MADINVPKTANGVSPEEKGLEPGSTNSPSNSSAKSNVPQKPFNQLGYPTLTKDFIKAFNEKRDELAKTDKSLSQLDCKGELNKKTDEAYAIVFNAYNNISRISDKSNSNERIRKLNLDKVGFFFKITPERTNEVLAGLIEVSNLILTGELGLKSDKTIYDVSGFIIGKLGYANTPGHSKTTNFSQDAIKDLIDNKDGYFIHALIHETIHRVTSFGKEFQAFDVYDFQPKFDELTLDEQLKNPDSYTNLYIMFS